MYLAPNNYYHRKINISCGSGVKKYKKSDSYHYDYYNIYS